MHVINIWPQEKTEKDGEAEFSCIVEGLEGERSTLWYRFPLDASDLLTESSDPYAIALVFLAMQNAAALQIHGKVSSTLIKNLEEFSAIWNRWKPSRYTPIEISAEEETRLPSQSSDRAVVAFSGGVDACYSVYRHAKGLAGRQTKNVTAGLMVHGFDIPLKDTCGFDSALIKNQRILRSLGISLVSMRTNWRQLGLAWEDAHGAALGAALSFLEGRFGFGIIGSGEPYEFLPIPWGSSPLTDHLFSSEAFGIYHDGAAASRTEKVAAISSWEEACRDLRVCWEGAEKDKNCGRCEKCIRTILNFKAANAYSHESLPHEVTIKEIRKIRVRNAAQYNEFLSIAKFMESVGRDDEAWVSEIKKHIRRYERGESSVVKIIHAIKMKIALSIHAVTMSISSSGPWNCRISTMTRSTASLSPPP